ncbi:MAG: iron-sulfur cluster assembly accessory protein [Candidatus Hydrogenedentes bacterium]|nr:iron-sulfur cluster assembly accessory protein [Candidatus Hydrogenedentota bacterium]
MTTEQATPQKALIQATDSAVEELKKLLTQQDQDAIDGIRLGVKGGGCSGLSYVLDFDKKRDGDNTFEQNGVTFLMDRKSSIYLKGIVLDYKEGLQGKGFTFMNPNATSTCGCGESFSV